MDELGQVMGHSGQHYGAVQPHTAIPRLTIAPLRPHTTRMDHHWAWEKHPANADHSSPADSGVRYIEKYQYHNNLLLSYRFSILL